MTAVSCHQPNVLLLREACASELAPSSFTDLTSKQHVHDYVAAIVGDRHAVPPRLVLLDLESAIEASWWCVEALTPHFPADDLPIVALAEEADQSQAETRFGSAVRAVLPIPRTRDQAKSLIRLVATAWLK